MSVETNELNIPSTVMVKKADPVQADSGFETSGNSATDKGDSVDIIIPFQPLVIDIAQDQYEVVLHSSACDSLEVKQIHNFSTIDGSANANREANEDGKPLNS